MYDTTKVKTYTPQIPAGTGPTSTNPREAVMEIVRDLEDQQYTEQRLNDQQIEDQVTRICTWINVADWIDGEYTIFPGYEIIVETMAKGRLDELPEFNGY